MSAKHTPGPLRFDGCGINGGDKYASRIATFAKIRGDDANHYGPLFAASPEMSDLLLRISRSACLDQRLGDRCICFSCEAGRLIAKAEGGK